MDIQTASTLNKLRPLLRDLESATQTLLNPSKLHNMDRIELSTSTEGKREDWFDLKVFTQYPSGPRPASSWARSWIKKIPEANIKKSDPGHAIASMTDTTALMIFATWDMERILFRDEYAEKMFEFLLKRFLLQTSISLMAAKFKLNREVPDMPEGWLDHPEMPLTDYQKTAVRLAWKNPSYAYFMQQGTGKTPTAVNLVTNEALQKDGPYFNLVVCPGQVRSNWVNEFERFSICAGKIGVLRGNQTTRVKQLIDIIRPEPDCHFHTAIISYDSLVGTMEALKAIPWDRAVLDESHYIKANRAQRTKAVHELKENIGRRLILTGTPIPNSIFELFSQFEFLGPGLSGFRLSDRFRKFYGKWSRGKGQAYERLDGLKNLPLVQERLTRLSFIVKKHEANLGLPEKRYNILEVEMSKTQSEMYETMKKELCLEITEYIKTKKAEGKDFLVADHILTQMLRLAQITSGFVKTTLREETEDGDTVVIGSNVTQINQVNSKAATIIDDMQQGFDDDPNAKKLVWCNFIEDIRVMCESLMEAGIPFVSYHPACPPQFRVKGTEESVRKFNEDPSIRVWVGNPASGAEGMNILGYDYWEKDPKSPCYTDQEYFFSADWSAVKRAQAEDRAHRRGTRAESVIITDVVVPGTIDEEIRVRVTQKRAQSENIQAVKDILSNVLDINL